MTTTSISDLTSGSLTGDGIFDKLMEATTIRLDDAFRKNRILLPITLLSLMRGLLLLCSKRSPTY
jgi:hypothetical protein